jgi:hypothetical protein
MKERARKYIQALKPSLIRALKQYQTTIIATHVPPYELHGPMAARSTSQPLSAFTT